MNGHFWPGSASPTRADSVAKLFWAPERATLIQEQRLRRNIDSTNPSPRFDIARQPPLAEFCNRIRTCRKNESEPKMSAPARGQADAFQRVLVDAIAPLAETGAQSPADIT